MRGTQQRDKMQQIDRDHDDSGFHVWESEPTGQLQLTGTGGVGGVWGGCTTGREENVQKTLNGATS